MSESRLITTTDKNDKGQIIVDWTQVLDDAIQYDTDNEEEVMKAKSKERKRQKAAEQAQAEREKAEAEKAAWEAKETRVCKEEERWEAKRKHKAEASKSDEAGTGGTSGEAGGEVKRVVMDPSCTCCTWAQVVCEFLIDSNKKRVACMHCNQSKGGDGKDAEATPKAAPKADKGKKRKADDKTPEPRPSKKKAKAVDKPLGVLDINEGETSGSRPRGPSAAAFSGLEDKLERVNNVTGLIANNLVGLFKAHEAMAKNSGRITDVLEAMFDESYSFRMAVSPLDSGSSELDSHELREEADWLKAHGKDEEEESGGEDETMAKAE
ncbi:hypothetical protein M404DRAFT_26205 [Pisolithus tinctorius Marx 270]|uniref:Uncharacterized protein n=1 Tax=Pisolithus tinctorius Marx 270 TaxID=870435 RepID=A0A0C3NU12_PISTI|nr:hypothetical protein M404DRAFT_26205 [Pisolithus tinctorius Marx 270]